MRDADIARRPAEGSYRKAGRLTLHQVRADPTQVNSTIQALVVGGTELVVVDIAEQEYLKGIGLGAMTSFHIDAKEQVHTYFHVVTINSKTSGYPVRSAIFLAYGRVMSWWRSATGTRKTS